MFFYERSPYTSNSLNDYYNNYNIVTGPILVVYCLGNSSTESDYSFDCLIPDCSTISPEEYYSRKFKYLKFEEDLKKCKILGKL